MIEKILFMSVVSYGWVGINYLMYGKVTLYSFLFY